MTQEYTKPCYDIGLLLMSLAIFSLTTNKIRWYAISLLKTLQAGDIYFVKGEFYFYNFNKQYLYSK